MRPLRTRREEALADVDIGQRLRHRRSLTYTQSVS